MTEFYDSSLVEYLLAGLTGWEQASVSPHELPRLKREHPGTRRITIESELVDNNYAINLGVLMMIKQKKKEKLIYDGAKEIATLCSNALPVEYPGIFIALPPNNKEVSFYYFYSWVADGILRRTTETEELAGQCERILEPMVYAVNAISGLVAEYIHGEISNLQFESSLQLALNDKGEA